MRESALIPSCSFDRHEQDSKYHFAKRGKTNETAWQDNNRSWAATGESDREDILSDLAGRSWCIDMGLHPSQYAIFVVSSPGRQYVARSNDSRNAMVRISV